MAIIQSGASNTTTMTVDPTMLAARVSERPPEILGSYQAASVSGALTGVAANGLVYSFRWAPTTSTNLCMIRRVEIGFTTTTAFSAAQGLNYALFIDRNYTVSPTGGTALAFTAPNSGKMRTAMPNSAFVTGGDIRISSTAAVTAGTRTIDTNPIAFAQGFSTAIGTGLTAQPITLHQPGDYPLIFAANEGFEIQNVIAMGATGVIQLTVMVEWMELAATTGNAIAY
jgi:hypothetical protein